MKPGTGALKKGQEIAALFSLEPDAIGLIDRFVSQIEVDCAEPAPFIAAARGEGGECWATRRIALLMLEHLAWRRPEELTRLAALLRAEPLAASLWRRIDRLARIHNGLIAGEFGAAEWANFFHAARQECRLTLARWLWTADEVTREIRARMAATKGTANQAPAMPPMQSWTGPAWETEIVNALRARHDVYWVTPRVSSDWNALVEYPINSASMVIKPPGSDLEIQIKRSGLRGARPFDVVYERNGEEIPSSHRLQGGSLGWLADREARASALFAKVYTAVHGEPCPCNDTLDISSVVEVPSDRGPVHILDYLTHEETFGGGFERMRDAMRRATAAFPHDSGVRIPAYEGPRGETLQFIAQTVPRQAIQINTTSYRLEHAANWLTEAGMRKYLEATGRQYSIEEAVRFGCDVMDEALAGFTPAPCDSESFDEFVTACFLMPENRVRADDCYHALLAQTGKVWGTLLGVRGYTDGESFVIRNSGLRTVWTGERWEVSIRFMDHDDMVIVGWDRQRFWPSRGLQGMSWDELHIEGGQIDGMPVKGIAGALREIYRVSDVLAATGIAGLQESARAAYRKTTTALREVSALRQMFPEPFVERIGDLDAIVVRFLESGGGPEWRSETREFLNSRGYSSELVDEHLRAVQNNEAFLRRMAFLFLG